MGKSKAVIVTIGDELLIGQTVDTNSAWMGNVLSAIGIEIVEKLVVSDSQEGIISGIERAKSRGNIILLTGGLGPTKDDITKKVLAEYFGMGMRFDVPTHERIIELFKRLGRSTDESHREQCYMPDGAQLLDNRMGTAPGMLFEVESRIFISMPGVPFEMKYIMENGVLPLLKVRFVDQAIVHHTILTAGEGESRIESRIKDIIARFPKNISIAYLPNLGTVKLRLTATGASQKDLELEIATFSKEIVAELGDLVFGYGKQDLAEVVGILALEKGLTIGTAESCTGGKVASKIVKTPGSSQYFMGSTVTYSYELKTKMLGVRKEILERFGAVSEEVVKEMVLGANIMLGVDVSVAISGIAGPSGGTADKPVGTIWIACGNKTKMETIKIQAGKDREKNIEYASNYALNVLRKFLQAQ